MRQPGLGGWRAAVMSGWCPVSGRLTDAAVFFAALAESGRLGRNWPGRWPPRPCWWGGGRAASEGSEIIFLCCMGGARCLWSLTRSLTRLA
jgi:hypothetical protein